MAGRFVVAIDFGTTYSGFAFCLKLLDDEQQSTVRRFFEWPGANNFPGRHYCKTITALFYVGDEHGRYQLEAWGWPALDRFTEEMKLSRRAGLEIWSTECGRVTSFSLAHDGLRRSASRHHTNTVACASFNPASGFPQTQGSSRFGCFVTHFKTDLIKSSSQRLFLPGDLDIERLIADYLNSLVGLIMEKLQSAYNNRLCKEDVEWCLTVPSIWDIQAKQRMIACAVKAGLCTSSAMQAQITSPTSLDIILEPEGASVYCQLHACKGMLKKGDRMMIADVGGGTIDLVLHSKAEDGSSSTKVHEEVSSYGELGGGTYIDAGFFRLLSQRIGPRFEEICWQEAGTRLKLHEWWQGIKKGFNGNYYSVSLEIGTISSGLHSVWKEEQFRKYGPNCAALQDDELWLEDEDFRHMFDPEVDKVINLIDMQVTCYLGTL